MGTLGGRRAGSMPVVSLRYLVRGVHSVRFGALSHPRRFRVAPRASQEAPHGSPRTRCRKLVRVRDVVLRSKPDVK